jgi:hypothetical protein
MSFVFLLSQNKSIYQNTLPNRKYIYIYFTFMNMSHQNTVLKLKNKKNKKIVGCPFLRKMIGLIFLLATRPQLICYVLLLVCFYLGYVIEC